MVDAYYAAGAMEKGDALLEDYAHTLQEYIEYYICFDGAKAASIGGLLKNKVDALDALSRLAAYYQRTEQYEAIEAYFDLWGEEEAPAETPGQMPPVEVLPAE